MANKHPGGRPTIMTDVVVGKLEYAFSLGCGDRDACLYAGINPDTLYEYQKKHPEFTDRKSQLKQKQIIAARQAVNNALALNDVTTARWLLERKCKDEFSTKTEIQTEPQTIIKYITPDERAAMDAHIDSVINDGRN